ncbi:putative ATP-dependent helicase C17A2.12-like protein 1 [Colletotrichum chlorophyti]|uniref:Putative ATP-dependent helicase C17A2.12-like protein 1 n=1 Tax=Colletotrichum chlorophyti TaxID=708187 RepID=A0A1Q8RWE5_9PEZI|nr:putative ATP-dependent helicase C17A2.12-like protein 1 [Colletotrichum chlorophyti]
MSSPSNYIPLGCLVLTQESSGISADVWKQLQNAFDGWACISPAQSGVVTWHTRPLNQAEEALMASDIFKNFKNLITEKWIRMEVTVTSDGGTIGVVRVYVLPDDVDNRAIDRDRKRLRNSRTVLISRLDFSPEAWAGRPPSDPVSIDSVCSQEGDPEDDTLTLLQLFNAIPSPDPEPEVITNPADQEATQNVLASDIVGLRKSTTLYDYQRRSAAVMIQRESSPGRHLDPRLLKGTDQNGNDFFFDTSAGTLLREPRYYDGVRGGILAEQMGAGKTLICLSIILATRISSVETPEIYQGSDIPVRKRIGSLADMAAACATRKAAPWKTYFNYYNTNEDLEYARCLAAIERNPGNYTVPGPLPKRPQRLGYQVIQPKPRKIWHSHASLVIVPNNLIEQWLQEIRKHTASRSSPDALRVLELTSRNEPVPSAQEIALYDIVLISTSRLDRIYRTTMMRDSPLAEVHYKRCIVDEGHKLGHSKMASKSNLLLALDSFFISARWIVTGTPSTGLYGVDEAQLADVPPDGRAAIDKSKLAETEKQDLERIGAIASLYLNARPWSNTHYETEDKPADWAVYVMQPKHSARSSGRKGVLRATLNSLLIRHRLSELNNLLPTVQEDVVVLDGSYQDKLSLNVFSMMIIFNAVQSQRTDVDYFFHPRQRKALLQLVHNLKQASFFGGSFFANEDIQKSLETAEEFLDQKKVLIGDEDEVLLKQAMEVARTALGNQLKHFSNKFNEIPVFVRDFLPNRAGAAWSLDDKDANPVCTDAGMVIALQRLIRDSLDDTTKLNSLLNGKLEQEGHKQQAGQINSVATTAEAEKRPSRFVSVLAGKTGLGGQRIPRNLRSSVLRSQGNPHPEQEIPDVLEEAKLVSTVSAKLSYLIDAVVEHQEQEKLIIFYENENVAWYLASLLEVIQIPHLIYAAKLSYERKMQYINTFNLDAKFRVILMDLSQAAVGLDMRAASRIYFISPVLNPQTQAQAIGRARRISQQKPVTVETLVLRDSIEEVIVERKKSMSQTEHMKCKTILDDRSIYNWILNAGIIPLPEAQGDYLSQAVPLRQPLPIFGGGFGHVHHPDQDIMMSEPESPGNKRGSADAAASNGLKRAGSPEANAAARPARRLRFAEEEEDDAAGAEAPARQVRFADE